jgi:hypothetical protein
MKSRNNTQSFLARVHSCRDEYFQANETEQLTIVNELRLWVRNQRGRFQFLTSGRRVDMDDELQANTIIRQSFVTEQDFIAGDEGAAAAHVGTLSFRAGVHNHHTEYFQQRDPERRRSIVNELRGWVRNRGGRFLTMDGGRWVEMNEVDVDVMIRQNFVTDDDVIAGVEGAMHDGTLSFRARVHNHRNE